jgi:hypothetical protein
VPGLLTVATVLMALCVGAVAACVPLAASGFQLSLSTSASRTAPTALEGATVHGSVYVFTVPAGDVSSVRFSVDDAAMAKAPTQVEDSAPFDLAGTAGAGGANDAALPFDTRTLSTGPHMVTAAVVDKAGSTESVTAHFMVDNRANAPKPTAAPTTVPTTEAPTTEAPTTVAPPPPKPTPTTTAAPAPPKSPVPTAGKGKLLFGIGTEAIDARNTALAQQAPVRVLSSWYNGPNDLGFMTGWKNNVVPEAYASGRAMHLIVWTGDPEVQLSTAYGPACGRSYPLSDRFIGDMQKLATTFAGAANGPPLYVTMFTEFQTYPCADNEWDKATNYYLALKDQYRKAQAAFKSLAPNARVSLGWGGWQASWDSPGTGGGRSLFPHFADVMKASDFQSFQAMDSKSNVTAVRDMTKALAAYGPVMLAHYKPDNGSAATFEADLKAMFTDSFIAEITGDGLFAFSFMDNNNLSNSAAMQQLALATVKAHAAGP